MISLPTHSNTERPEVGLFSCRNYGLVTPSLPNFHGRYPNGRNQVLLSAPLSIAKTHKGLLTLTGMVVIDVLPVVAVTTVCHQATHAQDNNATALWANRPRGCYLRRRNDTAARRYCCLHRLLSSVSRLRAASPPFPNQACRTQTLPLADDLRWADLNIRGDKTARVLTLAYYSVVGTTLGNPSKRYYSICSHVWQ